MSSACHLMRFLKEKLWSDVTVITWSQRKTNCSCINAAYITLQKFNTENLLISGEVPASKRQIQKVKFGKARHGIKLKLCLEYHSLFRIRSITLKIQFSSHMYTYMAYYFHYLIA